MATPKKLKNGRWRVTARYKSFITGEWKSSKKIFNTKAEANAWSAQVIADANLGQTSKSVALGTYYDHWLNTYKKPFVEHKTIKRIESTMNHALSFFGPNKNITEISKGNYQIWLSTESKTLAHQTVRSLHSTFKAMMETAVDEGIITRNPCKGAKIGGISKPLSHPRLDVLTLSQYKSLLYQIINAPESVSKYACILQALTGMRVGELLGLQWSKIDFTNKTILIDGQYDYNDSRERTHLKDHTDPRRIAVQSVAFDYLTDYRKWQQTSLRASNVLSMDGYLFVGINGKPITGAAINKYLAHQCQKIGLTRITSHSWRRTQATLMTLANNNDKFIASFLGHSVETLQKYYVRETDDFKKQNNDLREAFFESQGIG